MQRYQLVEKVKDSQVIGILVGTVVVDGYLDLIN
jgi:diphthamide biosynthesis enzyme Dph1/Dph2-like protein